MSVSVTITRDDLKPFISTIAAKLRGPDIKRAMGRGVARAVFVNFETLQTVRPNRMGWPRQGYWASSARSVSQPKLVTDGIVVSITKPGIAARYFGPAEIKPVTSKFLAIPATADAYGTRPIDARWSGKLEFSMVAGRLPALVMRSVRRVSKKMTSGVGDVIFWLKKKVTMPQDKTVLPGDDDLVTAAIIAGQDYIQAQVNKK